MAADFNPRAYENEWMTPVWNIKETLQRRTDSRMPNWDIAFNANVKAVTTEIAVSIARKIFDQLEKCFSDPFATIPSDKNRLEFKLSFNIPNPEVAKKIGEWAGETKDKPPFKQWVEKFSNTDKKENREYTVVNRVWNPNEEIMSKMKILADSVAENLRQKINAYCELPLNRQLKYDVIVTEGKARSSDPLSIKGTFWIEDNNSDSNEDDDFFTNLFRSKST